MSGIEDVVVAPAQTPSHPSRAASLAALYARIPSVDCIPGCTDCCGPIPLPLKEERDGFGHLSRLKQINGTWYSADMNCPNSRAGSCRVHDSRPFICRLFGTVDVGDTPGTSEARMVCPHGRKPAKPLTQREAAAITLEYFDLVRAKPYPPVDEVTLQVRRPSAAEPVHNPPAEPLP